MNVHSLTVFPIRRETIPPAKRLRNNKTQYQGYYYSGHKESNNLHRDIVILRVLRGTELTSQSAFERNIQPAWQSLKLLTRRYLNSGQGNRLTTSGLFRTTAEVLSTHNHISRPHLPSQKCTLTSLMGCRLSPCYPSHNRSSHKTCPAWIVMIEESTCHLSYGV